MENRDTLVKLILNNESRKAEAFLSEIRKNASNPKFADAREKILLVETAKALNERLPSFYADVKVLTADIFEENASTKECVASLCNLLRASVKAEKQNSYAKARDFMDARLKDNQLTVALVAAYTGLTRSELVKLFKENCGMTPGDYIGKKRAEESISYLEKNVSVEKAAYATGFSSVETYIRTFSKHMGLTPGMWKKKYL